MPKTKEGFWVLHIDGDAFFASCEVARRPDLKGKPVVIGEERGIATAFTYEAKALGIKRADPIFKIKKEYPKVTILSSHFDIYQKYNKSLRNLLEPHVEKIENYSIDECFCIIKGSDVEIREKVKFLKNHIQKKLGITYSFGVSINKTLAKVASKLEKPDGLTFLLDKETIDKTLKDMPIENIWGIGRATSRELHYADIRTVADFINCSFVTLSNRKFSQPVFETRAELSGEYIFEVAKNNPHQKSIMSTRNFINKTDDKKIIFSELSRHAEMVSRDLQKMNLYTKNLSVIIKYKDKLGRRSYRTETSTLYSHANSYTDLISHIERMFESLIRIAPAGVMYVGSGIHAAELSTPEDVLPDLFGLHEAEFVKSDLDIEIESLRSKFGFGSICKASSLNSINNRSADYKNRHLKDEYEQGLPYIYLGVAS